MIYSFMGFLLWRLKYLFEEKVLSQTSHGIYIRSRWFRSMCSLIKDHFPSFPHTLHMCNDSCLGVPFAFTFRNHILAFLHHWLVLVSHWGVIGHHFGTILWPNGIECLWWSQLFEELFLWIGDITIISNEPFNKAD